MFACAIKPWLLSVNCYYRGVFNEMVFFTVSRYNKTMKVKKTLLLLCLSLLLIYGMVGFFAYRAIHNEYQAIQFTTRQQSRQAAHYLLTQIQQQLQQTQSQLSAISQFTDLQPKNLKQLIDKTPSIKQIFILHQRQLQYPIATKPQPLSQQEKQFVDFLQPLVNDPSLLTQAAATEKQSTNSGWYYSQRLQIPTLIYWQERNNQSKAEQQIIGYELAYSVFRANVIAALDQQSPDGQFSLFENGQLLVTNQRQDQPLLNNSLTITQALPYPLQDWTIRYTSTAAIPDNRTAIGLAAIALLAAITLAAIVIYRETQRRIRLAKQQVQFVSQVSHELKTPLTNIRLYAEMLKENSDETGTTYRYLNVITDETQRLTRLIQNVLSFNQPPRLRLTNVPYVQLLQKIEQFFLPHFAATGLTIRQYIAADIPPDDCIKSDPDMLTQIIHNLMSNAEKYAANGRYVDIIVEKTQQTLIIAIRDYSNGISKSELKKITQPFYRVNNHITEGIAGTGIGLTIAQQLADYLAAELRIEILDNGMRFSLILPLV